MTPCGQIPPRLSSSCRRAGDTAQPEVLLSEWSFEEGKKAVSAGTRVHFVDAGGL